MMVFERISKYVLLQTKAASVMWASNNNPLKDHVTIIAISRDAKPHVVKFFELFLNSQMFGSRWWKQHQLDLYSLQMLLEIIPAD